MMRAADAIDDDMEERVWDGICGIAAMQTGVSRAMARSILEAHGYHAYGHTGVNDALEVLEWALGRIDEARHAI